MKPMLTPRQALRVLLEHARPLPRMVLDLEAAGGLLLRDPVRAPHPYPRFDNAALDGYALRARDSAPASPARPVVLRLVGTQFAGRAWKGSLRPGEALHVTTGAPLPRGADALAPYEAVRVEQGRVWLDAPVRPGRNARRRGEDGHRGAVLASPGERLRARRLAMLAAFGVGRVAVTPRPRVALAVGGDELIAPGRKPEAGQIFDSNGLALRGLLREAGWPLAAAARLPDSEAVLRRRLAALLPACDVLLVAGGMSVGERDFSKPVLESLGVRRVFWQVAQKPGKPLYFGVRGRQLVFGLPGNPAAVIACFAAYVAPCLRTLAGEARGPRSRAVLAHDLGPTSGKALFLKAEVSGQGERAWVRVLDGQGSHLLRSLALGNALLPRPAHAPAWKRGRRVEVLPL